MHRLGYLALLWLVKAVVVMISVAAVTPKNPENTLPRALVVSLLAAFLVAPFMGVIGMMLVIPFLIALALWSVIYALAYGIGPIRSGVAALVQAALGFVLEQLLLHGRVF